MARHFFFADGWFDRFLSTTALIMVMMVAVEGFSYLVVKRGPPIDILQVETLNSPVRAGEYLKVKITREKVRSCSIVSFRKAMDAGGRLYDLGVELPDAGEVGSPSITVNYPLPRDMPAGNYVLLVRLLYTCPDASYQIDQPETNFVVIK